MLDIVMQSAGLKKQKEKNLEDEPKPAIRHQEIHILSSDV